MKKYCVLLLALFGCEDQNYSYQENEPEPFANLGEWCNETSDCFDGTCVNWTGVGSYCSRMCLYNEMCDLTIENGYCSADQNESGIGYCQPESGNGGTGGNGGSGGGLPTTCVGWDWKLCTKSMNCPYGYECLEQTSGNGDSVCFQWAHEDSTWCGSSAFNPITCDPGCGTFQYCEGGCVCSC